VSDRIEARHLRVAIVCPYSLSRPGGVQGQVLGLAAALRSAGHEPIVLAPIDGPLAVPSSLERAFVSVGRSVPVPANGSVAPISLSPLGAIRALRTVRRGKFDVLHFHEPLAPGPGYACLLASSQPKVGTFHRAGAGLAYRALGPAGRLAARRLDVRCAVSPEAMSTASGALGGTYEVIGNGVEIERFSNAKPWRTNGPTVIFVGRHERRKGLEVLLDAWARLGEEQPHAHLEHGSSSQGPQMAGQPVLWVAGDGPQTEELRRRHPSSPRIEWLGRIDDDQLASRLSGAHLLCAPSLGGESFGVVLVEAMAARTAVIASDLPGYAYVAGGHAALVRPNDPVALADALRQGISDAASASGSCGNGTLGAALLHSERWSMTALAHRYEEIYEALVH